MDGTRVTQILAKRPRNLATLLSFALGSAFVGIFHALAEDPTSNPPGTPAPPAQPAPQSSSLLDQINLSYITTYYGGALNDITNLTEPTDWGVLDMGGKQHFENTVLTAYKLNDHGVNAGIGMNFFYYPFGGGGLELTAPYLKIADPKLAHTGEFNYSADFRTYLPLASDYQNQGISTRLRSVQVLAYQPSGSRFSFGYLASINYFFLNSRATDPLQNPTFDMSFVPGVSYQLNPKIAFNLDYEMETSHFRNNPAFDLTGVGTWLYPGVTWTPNERISLRPYLTLNPGTKVSAETSRFTCDFIAKIL